MNSKSSMTRIGIVGTGFIGQGIVLALESQQDLQVTKVLTRRKINPEFKNLLSLYSLPFFMNSL